MRKPIFITGVMLLISFISLAQDCTFYYPKTEGKQLEYSSYDAKDKLTGSSIQTVKELSNENGVLSVSIHVQSFDKKGKDLATNEYKAKCENGVYMLDMKSFMDATTIAAYEDGEIKVSGNNLEIPANLKVGDELPNGRLNASIYSNGARVMGMSTALTNRKVEAKEEITTEAGTFECYKISYTMTVSTMFSVRMEAIDWICEDIGTVKSESYSRGKIMSYTVLTAIK